MVTYHYAILKSYFGSVIKYIQENIIFEPHLNRKELHNDFKLGHCDFASDQDLTGGYA